jgi:hypothetical protein
MSGDEQFWPDTLEFWPEPDMNSLLSGLAVPPATAGCEQDQHQHEHQHHPHFLPHLSFASGAPEQQRQQQNQYNINNNNGSAVNDSNNTNAFDAAAAAAAAAAAVTGGSTDELGLLFPTPLGNSDAAGVSGPFHHPQLPSLPGIPNHLGIPGLLQPQQQQFFSLPSNSGNSGDQGVFANLTPLGRTQARRL